MRRLAWFVAPLVIPLALMALWESQSRQGGGHAYAFAPLAAVTASFVSMISDGSLLANASASLVRALTGLALGGGIGVVVGAVLGSSRLLERFLGPLIDALRQVPLLGWMPLIALWFGNGDDVRLGLVCLSAFYPMALNTQRGFHAADRALLEVGALYGLSRWQKVKLIGWPSALPIIFTGLSQAIAFTWIATIGTELLFSASSGLGVVMTAAQVATRSDVVLVCILCLALMGFILNHGFGLIRQRVLRWQPVRGN